MKNNSFFRIIGAFAVAAVFLAMPSFASAFWDGFPFRDRSPFERIQKVLQLCPKTITAAGISITVLLPGVCAETPPEEPEPEEPETPAEPTLEFFATPGRVDEGDSSTLAWEAEHADTCTASDGWEGNKPTSGNEQVSPEETTEYTLTCEGEGGEVSKSVIVTVVPAPPLEPASSVVINEIAWMGSVIEGENDGGAEWIELRNLGDEDVDLEGWTLVAEDGNPNISITSECVNTTIPAHGFFLLARATSTAYGVAADCTYPAGFAAASNLLQNTGELLELRDALDGLVDSVEGRPDWEIGGLPQKGNNTSSNRDTAQRDDDGEWFTAPPTPGAPNVAPSED